MRKEVGMKTIGLFLVFCVAATLGGMGAQGRDMDKEIVLASDASLLTAPVWLVQKKGYFRQEGVNVTIMTFASGKASLAAMLKNKDIDLCCVADTPIVFNSFDAPVKSL